MNRVIFLLLFPLILQAQIGLWRIKRLVFLPSGADYAYISCGDTDHNGLNEMVFTWWPPNHWEIWEHRPENQYQLVYADTGAYPYPPGITTGNFEPWDIGDIDQDSLTDLLGPNVENANGSLYNVVTTQESYDYYSYPESLSWWYRITTELTAVSNPFYFSTDLDDDTKKEILAGVPNIQIGAGIWENVANNQNELVWHRATEDGYAYAFDDFDLDDRKEFVTAGLGSLGRVFIYENTGDNQYELVGVDTVRIPNGSDVFSGNDLDGDGKPEFFVGFAQWVGGEVWDFYLYRWEATGNNAYQRTLIDQVRRTSGVSTGRRSYCSDLDGDGVEEIIWSTRTHLSVYKATGNNQFQKVWEWINDHSSAPIDIDVAGVNSYDMNKNGYNEIVFGGNAKTSIFEVEAVYIRRPNGGENFQGNTQELIRWWVFRPPRCDSLSIFFSSDNGRNYEVIATGIPGTDSSYLWTVPNISSDSCKIRIIAYGPGWQYDESDYVFRITAVGIEESRLGNLSHFKLEIQPNIFKSKTAIRFSLPANRYSQSAIRIYNVQGKLVKSFLAVGGKRIAESGIVWDGTDDSNKRLPSGVYFLRLESEDYKITKKIILTE